MIEEKWIRKFRANNPFLTDRMKKLDDQRRVESVIMTDLGYIVAYQHNFIRTISIDLVRLKKMMQRYKNNTSTDTSKDYTEKFKRAKKNQQLANTEDTIRLIKLANQLRKALFQTISFNVHSEDDLSFLQKIHDLFDEMIYYRNIKCTQYRNTFAPLPVFRLSPQDTSNSQTTSPKCHGFSKILYRSSPYIDSTYLPTKSSINQIQKSIKDQNLYDSLKTLSNELNRTNKELLILKSDYQVTNILVRDFILFPPFDVIRESPIFKEFNNSISYSINYVRSEISSLQKSVSNLISHIIPKFDSSIDCISNMLNYVPELSTEVNNNNDNNKFDDLKHRLILFQNIIESSNVFQPHTPDYESIKYIHFDHKKFSKLNEIKDKDYEKLSSKLDKVIEKYLNFYDSIDKENENLQIKQAEIKEEINKLKTWKIPSITDDMKRTKEKLLSSISELENEQIGTAQLLKDTISDFKSKIKDIKVINPLFPLNFEDMLIEHFNQNPKMTWINQKLDYHRTEYSLMKKTVENLKLNSQDLRNEIDEKRQIRNLLLEKRQSESSHQKDDKDELNSSNSRKSSHHPKYLCTICKTRKRDAIISLCGHTFCRKCLLVLLRKGSQRCPHCNTFFSEPNIKPILL